MKPKWQKTNHPGVMVWHEKDCPAYEVKRCRCDRTFRGEVWNPDTKRPDKSRRFAHVNEAISWVAAKRNGAKAPVPVVTSGMLITEFFATFITAARAGTALRKGGKRYSART